MGKLLGSILWGLGQFVIKIGDSINGLGLLIRELALRLQFPLETVEVKPKTIEEVAEEMEDLFPHSFATFKDGMKSSSYCTRHDAAAKLVGWYLHQDGHPYVEDLVRAAKIFLEDTPATKGDVSYLVGAWKDQASATTDKDLQDAEEREAKIYQRLAEEIKNQGDK
jgi:hypothetical protein